jgi:subtilisin family serine protease
MASGQQPLSIMRVGEALSLVARPPVDIPVLVADTGLDLEHPDLAPRLLGPPAPGSDLVGTAAPPITAPDSDPSDPLGGSGHGTAVAGVLAAAWNNGVGGAGVAPNARLIPMRTCWDDDQCYQYIQADAFNRAIDHLGARVVSMSWLVGAPEADFVAAIRDHPNTLFVSIPSGNGGATDADPDAANRAPCSLDLPNVLCVTTSAPDGGLSCGDYGATLVDVAVPTENSVTTTNGGGFGPTGCATSYAAPTAAGLATILFGFAPAATPAQVRQAIIAGARSVPAWQGRSVSGGIADAVGAVRSICSQSTCPAGASAKRKCKKKNPHHKHRSATSAKKHKKKCKKHRKRR